MNDEIQQALIDLHDVLNVELGSNVVGVKIFISSHEYNLRVETRSPARLKCEGVSMKNLRGEWVK